MANILYIDHYAGAPQFGMEYRPYYLAKEWVKAGHSVTIVGASFAHTRHTQPLVTGTTSTQEIDGIRYIWVRTPEYSGNGLGRIRNMGAFVWALYRQLPRITHDWQPDSVIASSTYPLDFYPARKIARAHKAKLVFELHDLWPMSPMELGKMSRFHPFIQLMQRAEDAWCRDCDIAVSILPHADRHLRSRGLNQDKFVHIPNGIDLTEWTGPMQPLPDEHRAFLEKMRSKGSFLVGYAGAHGVANALEAFLLAATHLRDYPIELVLVGNGPEKPDLIEKAKALNLDRVTFLSPLPKKAIPNWLSQIDCHFLGGSTSSLYMFGMSFNKIFDYMMSAKPIINALKASNDPVHEAQCGISTADNSPEAIANAVLDLYRTDPATRQAMGLRGYNHILKNHTYPVLAKQFLDILHTGSSHD